MGDPDQVTVTICRYGSDGEQYAELFLPGGDPFGVAVVLHGGFWRAFYDASLGRPLALDLAARGWAAYNVEYRRVGNGGGWPATLLDVAAALDHLAELDVDLTRVVTIGHSAGGHLAVWAAGRAMLPGAAPGSSPQVAVTGAVAQAGVLDLRTGAARSVGGTAIADFLGGAPDEVPDRYDWADPIARVPLAVPVVCVHGHDDDSVPLAQSQAYVAAATAAGGEAELVVTEDDHMAHVDPASNAWAVVIAALTRFTKS